MSALEAARPRRRVFWSDLRFFLGIALILASVGGVWVIVDAATRTQPVLAAARTLVPGDTVTAADLRPVDAVLGGAEDAYVAPGNLTTGTVVTRTVREGELLPASALEPRGHGAHTAVVISNSSGVPSGVVAGAVVELWSAPRVEGGLFGAPSILVADATVAEISESASMVGGAAAEIELIIPRTAVSATLEAITGGAALSVIPSGATS